jgi:hypothetical protein
MDVNTKCEIVAREGKLEGLRTYLNNLMKINQNPLYRGDLSDEMDRVKDDIKKTEKELDDIKISIDKKYDQK